MYRKIQLGFLAVIFLVCLILDSGTQAQLNFSTGWGKRSERRGASDSTGSVVECGSGVAPKLEQLLNVYFLIQVCLVRLLLPDGSAKNVGLSEAERVNGKGLRSSIGGSIADAGPTEIFDSSNFDNVFRATCSPKASDLRRAQVAQKLFRFERS